MKATQAEIEQRLQDVRGLIAEYDAQIEALEAKQNDIRQLRWRYKIEAATLVTRIDLMRPKLSSEKVIHLKPR